MSQTVVVEQAGFPFLSILTLIFITLKLTGHINWTWLWVLSPIWITLLFVLAVLLLCLLVHIFL